MWRMEAGVQQLEAFVCEEVTEANDLMQELRQKFSNVSVIHGNMGNMGTAIWASSRA